MNWDANDGCGLGDAYADVREFHRACGLPCSEMPREPSMSELNMREALISEEARELEAGLLALRDDDVDLLEAMTETADAIADLIYVLLGTAATFGLPMVEIWRRVHESNMAKVRNGVIRRADGKILKPEGWEPPDVAGAIRDAMEDK